LQPLPQQQQQQQSFIPRSTTPTSTTSKPSNKLQLQSALVLFDFLPSSYNTLELPLIKGETVTILRRVDSNWYEGKIGSKRGIFPVSYVRIIEKQPNNGKHSYTPNAFHLNPADEEQFSYHNNQQQVHNGKR
jgi:hypothetical protein